MDFTGILEEIALEGLDGITLNALWLRLEKRPGFHSGPIDDFVKQYIWKLICQSKEIEFFLLESPRPELAILDLNKYANENRFLLHERIAPDIYSFKVIDENGVLGCCDTFKTRVLIDDKIRSVDASSLMSCQEANEKWGQRLAIVASQRLRFQALIQTNFRPSGMIPDLYAILERVGRSRYSGEPSSIHARKGLINESMTSSNLFNMIKKLVRRGWMIKQPINIYLASTSRAYHARLFHLRRFYQRTTANSTSYLNKVCLFLLSRPNRMATSEQLDSHVGLKIKDIAKLTGLPQETLCTQVVPYSLAYPDDPEPRDEYEKERQVKVLKLPDDFRIKETYDDDDNDLEEKDKMASDTVAEEPGTGACLTGAHLYDKSISGSIKYMIDESGTEGLTEVEIRNQLHITPRVMVTVMKRLLSSGVVVKSITLIQNIRTNLFLSVEADAKLKQMKSDKNLTDAKNKNDKPKLPRTGDVKEEGSNSEAQETPEDSASSSQLVDEIVKSMNMTWIIEKKETPTAVDESANYPMKRTEREIFILRRLKQKKVYIQFNVLLNDIFEHEKELGWKELMCRKSLKRILKLLYEQGRINHVKVTWDTTMGSKSEVFICDTSVTADDPVLRSAVGRHYTYTLKFRNVKKHGSGDAAHFVQPMSLFAMLQTDKSEKNANKTVNSLKPPGFKSPFKRYCKTDKARTLHEFIFYLLYGYEGNPGAGEIGNSRDEKTEPPVYLDVNDWRRHVPPIKIHDDAMLTKMVPGACMIGDLIIAMPLVIFLKLVFISWKVDGLKELLDDNVKKLYPIKCLPKKMLSAVLFHRCYLSKLNETLKLMCHFGLLSYGPRVPFRQLEYVTLYLHKKAMVLDTTSSDPGYVMTHCPPGQEFPKVNFVFDTADSLRKYWNEIYLICMGSNIGRSHVTDVPGDKGELNLLDSLKPKEFCDIKEDDWLPGDRRGAGGFDSCLFTHSLKSWSTMIIKKLQIKRTPTPKLHPAKPKKPPVYKKKRVVIFKDAKSKRAILKEKRFARRKRKQAEAKEAPKEKRIRPERVLDKDDQEAQMKMDRIRSRFSSIENGIILISHVACLMLCPNRTMEIPFKQVRVCVRDIVPVLYKDHDALTEEAFKDKTIFSMRARSLRLTKDENFVQSVAFYLAKATYDKDLLNKYESVLGISAGSAAKDAFQDLVWDLFNKFRSPSKPLALKWPITVEELRDDYDVKFLVSLVEKKVPFVDFDCRDSLDIQACLLSDLLLSWIYNTKLVSNCEMYHSFCKYSSDVITRTCDSLKKCHIVTQTKRSHSQLQAPNRGTTLINSMVLSSRHKFEMRSPVPSDVFENAMNQLRALEDAFQSAVPPTAHRRKTSSQDASLSGPGVGESAGGSSRSSSVQKNSNQCQGGTEEESVDLKATDGYERLNWKEYQGGCPMALIPLYALDMVKCRLLVPDNMLRVSDSDKKKVLANKTDLGKRKADQMQEKASESNEDNVRPPPGKVAKKDTTSESTTKKQNAKSHGEPSSESGPSTSTDSGGGGGGSGVTDRSNADSGRRCVEKGNSAISFNSLHSPSLEQVKVVHSSAVSNTLLALARTHHIETFNFSKYRTRFKGNFKVEPLKMDLALKEESGVGGEPASAETETETEEEGVKGCQEEAMATDEVTATCDLPPNADRRKRRSAFTRLSQVDHHAGIISRMEQKFPLDFSQTDAIKEIRSTLPRDLVGEGEKVYQLIDEYGFAGISELELERVQDKPFPSTAPLINQLCDMNAILKVGITERRFVSRRYVDQWTIESYSKGAYNDCGLDGLQSSQVPGSYRIQCRPWRTLHGDLNLAFLQGALHRVMTFLFNHPGMAVDDITAKFNPNILPCHVRELLDILQELDCINMKLIHRFPKSSVFSTEPIDPSETGWLRSSKQVVDVKLEAPIYFGLFQQSLDKHGQAKGTTVQTVR